MKTRIVAMVLALFVLFTFSAFAAEEVRGILKDVTIFTDGSVDVYLVGEASPHWYQKDTYSSCGMWIIDREIVIKKTDTKWQMTQQSDFVITALQRFERDNPHRHHVGYAAPIAYGRGNLGGWVAFSTSDGNIILKFGHITGFTPPSDTSWKVYGVNDTTPTTMVAGNWLPERWQDATSEKRKEFFSQVASRLNLHVEEYL
ncbi:MAG: hypothetical protein WC726_02365 [Parcubacteria group bacterium]|jgi:hypothetical protein